MEWELVNPQGIHAKEILPAWIFVKRTLSRVIPPLIRAAAMEFGAMEKTYAMDMAIASIWGILAWRDHLATILAMKMRKIALANMAQIATMEYGAMEWIIATQMEYALTMETLVPLDLNVTINAMKFPRIVTFPRILHAIWITMERMECVMVFLKFFPFFL
jgi:hypothetical protein